MCFSSNASFVVSAVLVAGGIVAIKKTKKISQIPFAAIPLIFGVQQFIEGLLWLSLRHKVFMEWQESFTFVFLIFAQVVWPFWVPFSMLLLEKNSIRRSILKVILVLCGSVSVYLACCLMIYPSYASIGSHHIRYDLDYPKNLIMFGSLLYFTSTVVSPFISSVNRMPLVGSILLVTFIVSELFFDEYVISVWCYFAAAVSITILFIVNSFQDEKDDVLLNNKMNLN